MKWLYMEVSLCIQQMHFQNTIVEQDSRASLSSININGNISYEASWNIEYRCDSFVYFFLFTVNREEDIARESFSFKII